jgi:hypothetical protein
MIQKFKYQKRYSATLFFSTVVASNKTIVQKASQECFNMRQAMNRILFGHTAVTRPITYL